MKISRRSFIVGGAAAVAAAGIAPSLTGCSQKTKSGINPADFESNGVGSLKVGLENISTSDVPTKLYTITNKKGAELCVTNFGARIVSFVIPDKDGYYRDMVLGYDNIKEYATKHTDSANDLHGAVCGRYANRIKDGKFSIDGKTYQVDINENSNMLHGGSFGFHKQTFTMIEQELNKSITFMLKSNDGEMGFPGLLELRVTYSLNDNNTLSVYYSANSTSPTVINVSNHSFWDPCGDINAPITDDVLTIYSKKMTPVDSQLIPTGEIVDIPKGSVFDFFGDHGEGKLVGRDKDVANEQLSFGKGYDHNFVLMTREEAQAAGAKFDGNFEITDDGSSELQGQARLAADIKSSLNGFNMRIVTTEPGLQFFDCHNMDGTMTGKGKTKFTKYCAFVLEPQHFPDSPNHSNFPSTLLRPNQIFQSKTEYRFTQ